MPQVFFPMAISTMAHLKSPADPFSGTTRMREIGVPNEAIGNVDRPGKGPGAFVQRNPAVGGTQSVPGGRPGISVDTGVLMDDLSDVPGWADASVQDRIDVIAAHEWTELNTPSDYFDMENDPALTAADRHMYAVENAWKTDLNISDKARAILQAEAEQEGFED
jgi:hypothetical protein